MKAITKLCATAAMVAFSATGALAAGGISNGVVKIGVLGDMSGVYSTGFSGPGAVAAVKMAVRDFGGKVLGKPIEVISADHQNKADVASSIARKWIDEDHVDMIADLTNSAVALAVQKLASDKHVITMTTGAATSALTGKACTKYGIHYGYDTHALPVGTATAIVKNGGKSWYFITADYAFGHALQNNTAQVVKALGGKVVGASDVPLGSNDFSSYLLQAQASGAQVIGLANAGQDTVNAIKQAHEFGIVQGGQQLAGMLVLISDVKSLGTNVAKGLQFTSAWYWNQDAASRKWMKEYEKFSNGAAPTFPHAADYSLTMAYLKAIKAAGTDNADAVRAELGKMKIDDFFAKGGQIRQDGLLVHDMYLLKVQQPKDGPWDVAKVVRTIPGKDAYFTLAKGGCPLVKS
ncbi:ABC transporter permease [Defluviimonas sp. 20V17]|uniref:ABC transporter permease n=1 Tax=Allgaiera indica TaxID=765699 RepID=A0AAN4ZYK9_9RHOB|nr:ABC transporter substrate-binding protein [Allgaiera indica]KDB03443.1 ABC transporter permease [Defluviimonas sp. 20V17]GHE00383.1 ABC transporter permease [Allgaiera indica]SDW62768.1 amino acid/amide ABC transporter substrate-binding protein, HAAT family [Allgaiera indica]